VPCVFLSAASFTLAALTNDWPQWRARNVTVYRRRALFKQWLPEDQTALEGEDQGWLFNPSRWNADLPDEQSRERICPFRLSQLYGKPVWPTRVGNVGNRIRTRLTQAWPPLTIDETSFTRWSDGDLSSRPAAGRFNGRRASAKSSAANLVSGPCRVPLVDGDVLVVAPGGAGHNRCAEQKTGGVIWKSSSPVATRRICSAIVVRGGPQTIRAIPEQGHR
jgi:hypothetical protein